MNQERLQQGVNLDGVTSSQAVLQACRRLSASLAEKIISRGLAWQEITVTLETETEVVTRTRRLARHQSPANLYLHASYLVRQMNIPSPVTGLTLTVTGLTPPPAEQLSLFANRHPGREHRLRQAVEEANRRYPCSFIQAGILEADRRERMLSFYDPLRQGADACAQTHPGKL